MHRPSSRLTKVLLTSTALTLVAGLPVQAQDQQAAVSQGAVIEEIIVTASKREESVYKTPINISAVGAAEIERQRLSNISDLARVVPGLTLVDQGSRGSSQLIVRGLSVQTSGGSEGLGNNNGETVATYIGDVPFYVDIRLADIERVEVLMGPQGTLYGAGTLGGAIRYIPKRPDTTAASVEVSAKAFDLAHGSGIGFDGYVVGNIPLVTDKLAVRAMAGYYRDPGFIDYGYLVQTPGVSNPEPDFTDPADVAANLTSKKDANDEKTFSGRVGLFFQATENINANLTYFYQDTQSGGRQVTNRASFGSGPYESAGRVLEPNRRQNNLVTLEANWDLNWATVTSATAYGDYDERGQRDQTDLLLNFEYGYEQFPAFVAFTREIVDEDRVSQELRVVSSDEGPFTWIVGGFYNYYNLHSTSEEFVPGFPDFIGADRADALEYFEGADQEREEKAGFGELAYQITNWWKVTVGGRYYSYSDTTTSAFDLPLASGAPTGINPTSQTNSVKDNGFLYKVNTSFNVTPDILLYGTVSEGYRLGGVNGVPPCLDPLPPGQNVCALPNEVLIKPDQTFNKEVGIKGGVLDNRMRLSLALFHINWKDIQTQGRTVNGQATITVNGGKAVSKGVEASLQAALTDNLTASLTYSYTDAYLTTDAPGLVNGVDAFAGDRVAGSPKHQFSGTLDYFRDLGNGYAFGANYSASYQSNVYTRVGLRNGGEALPGYDLHSMAISLAKDAWKISLYAENMFDQYYITSVRTERSFIRSVNGFRLRSFHEDVGRPRVVGLELKYRLGA
jgi:iron complex outermembrane receptor protein